MAPATREPGSALTRGRTKDGKRTVLFPSFERFLGRSHAKVRYFFRPSAFARRVILKETVKGRCVLHKPDFFPSLYPETAAILTCPVCGARRYANQGYVEFLAYLERGQNRLPVEASDPSSRAELDAAASLLFGTQTLALTRHKTCQAIMEMQVLSEEERAQILTVADLARVWFHAASPDGGWETVSADQASDEQFDAWARSRSEIGGDTADPWSLGERAEFCSLLRLDGRLVLLVTAPTQEDA